MLEGEEQALKVAKRLTFGPTFPFRLKQAVPVEDIFLANAQQTTEEVVCITEKITVSF